jgi:Tol biopolymer transport system component
LAVRSIAVACRLVQKTVRFTLTAPEDAVLSTATRQNVAVLSPDGRRVAFVALRRGAAASIWVRPLADLDAHPLPGTDGASYPFWSADSRAIGFFSSGKLRTVDVDGGQLQTICDAPNGQSGTWNRDGVILFAQTNTSGLVRVAATGGQPTPVTTLDPRKKEIGHRFPAFLPDGRRFLFLVVPTNTIRLGSLGSMETTELMTADSQAQYESSSGRLLFARGATVFAQPFDSAAAKVTGEAVAVAQQVTRDPNGYATFSVSDVGTLAYRTGTSATRTQLTWVNRTGQSIGRLGPPGFYRNPALAPDGNRVIVEVVDAGGQNQDLWIADVTRGLMSRFTFDSHNDIYAMWSADGSRVFFGSDRDSGVFNVYQKAASGTAVARRREGALLLRSGRAPDGRLNRGPDIRRNWIAGATVRDAHAERDQRRRRFQGAVRGHS